MTSLRRLPKTPPNVMIPNEIAERNHGIGPKQEDPICDTKNREYEGKDTFVRCGSDQQDFLFAVVAIDDGNAVIIDSGYRSLQEAADAWPEAVLSK